MRFDYQVLEFVAGAPSWASAMSREFRAGRFDGLYLKTAKAFTLSDLDVVRQLQGLRYLEVNGSIADDTAGFDIDGLEELILLTRCSVPLPRVRSKALARLGLDDRPGMERLAELAQLHDLSVWQWSGGELSFLNGATGLAKLHIEGVGQLASIHGIEACQDLKEIELLQMRVTSVEPLASLTHLRKLWIIGDPGISDEATIDLSYLTQLNNLEEVRLTFAGSVRSVSPLSLLTRLRDLRLRGTKILERDERVLAELSTKATVVLPEG